MHKRYMRVFGNLLKLDLHQDCESYPILSKINLQIHNFKITCYIQDIIIYICNFLQPIYSGEVDRQSRAYSKTLMPGNYKAQIDIKKNLNPLKHKEFKFKMLSLFSNTQAPVVSFLSHTTTSFLCSLPLSSFSSRFVSYATWKTCLTRH